MKKRILCYGDSNTYGHNPADCSRLGENARWTRLLAGILGDGYEVIEEGLCGRTTVYEDRFSPGLCGIDMFEPIIRTHSPIDLIVLMLGTNDLQLQFNATAYDSARGIERFAKTVRNPFVCPETTGLLIVSPILIDKAIANSMFADIYGTDRAVELSRQLAPEYERIAKIYHAGFINAADFAGASALDGVHMDAENHGALAAAIGKKITDGGIYMRK